MELAGSTLVCNNRFCMKTRSWFMLKYAWGNATLSLRVLLMFGFIVAASLRLHAKGTDSLDAEKRYSRAALVADVQTLTGYLEEVHPNMYHNISRKEYARLKQKSLAALHDGMSLEEAWLQLGPLLGALGEGHSYLDFPATAVAQIKAAPGAIFPLTFQSFDGKYFVVSADYSIEGQLLPGDRIVSINHIPAPALVDKLSAHLGGLQSWRALDVCREMIGYLYVYQVRSPFHITYLRDNVQHEVTIKGLDYAAYREQKKAKAMPVADKKPDQVFRYLDSANAYLAVNTLMQEPAAFKLFLDSVFTQLQQRPVPKLIIDIRLNGGGDSELGQILLGYLTDKPFRMAGGVKWKVSATYKKVLNERSGGKAEEENRFYFDKKNGDIITFETETPRAPAAQPLRFKGKVVVLIGTHTFSSANMLANAIGDYHLATLMGQPTGEPANDYGEIIQLELPNTKLGFTTATKQFIRANGDARSILPVMPDITVSDNSATPEDEVLEAAVRLQ